MQLPNRSDLEKRHVTETPDESIDLQELAKQKTKAALTAIIAAMDDPTIPASSRLKAAELVLEIANDKENNFTPPDTEPPFQKIARLIQEAKHGYAAHTAPKPPTPDTTPN